MKIFEGMNINCSFIPDMITYTLYKNGLCSLCKIEKKQKPDFNNISCPHCAKDSKMMSGSYFPKYKVQEDREF